MIKQPFKIKVFLSLIYIITFLMICLFIPKLDYYNLYINYKAIVFFSALIALTETFTVVFRDISFTTTFAIELAIFILYGPTLTIVTIIIGYSFRVIKVRDKYKHILNTPWYGTIFNYCVLILPVIYGTYIYNYLGGEILAISNIGINVGEILAFSAICFFVNTFIISILYSLNTSKKFIYSFMSNIKLALLNILAMAPFGIILSMIFKDYGYIGVLLMFIPIVLTRFTFLLYIDSKNQYIQTIDAFMHAIEARDKYTEGHSHRVADLTVKIARVLRYNEFRIEQLNKAALLHDIGKIGVSDTILNKPGKLTDEEFALIKSHPEIGYNIIRDIKNLDEICQIVKYHHERYDGKGYPEGKKADELPLDVFIVQLADSIDAMSTDRPYRKALSQEQIIDEIKKNNGTQFHPKVVEAYFSALSKKNT